MVPVSDRRFEKPAPAAAAPDQRPAPAAAVPSAMAEEAPPLTIDDAAESAFLAEARERGEVVPPRPAADADEAEPKALPPLDELVQKIPAEVRDVLEDLFRARFVTVKRFPKKAMK